MRRTPLLLAAALITALGTANTVEAATIPVTTTADATVADAVTSLREAIAQADATAGPDTITLAADAAYPLTKCAAPGSTLTYHEDSTLTIEGNGATITQTCDATRILQTTAFNAALVLEDLELVGGPNTTDTTTYGMAVLNAPEGASNGRIELTNVEVHGVDTSGGTVIEAGFGNGTSPSTTEVNGSNLHDNTGTAIGGSFLSIHVADSTITGNSGSGIGSVDGFPVLVENSTISGNGVSGVSTTGQGYPANQLTVTGSTVTGNGRGGIRCSFCGTVAVTDSTVTSNGLTAPSNKSGGIYTVLGQKSNVTSSTLTVTGSTVSGNAAQGNVAGGITARVDYVDDPANLAPVVSISGSTVNDNDAAEAAGGIRMGLGTINVSGSTISGNAAGTEGGGIATYATTIATLTGSTLTGNTAGTRAGGALLGSTAAMVTDSRISGNVASGGSGGGIAYLGTNLAVTRSTFDANTAAAGEGGAAYIDIEGLANVINTTLSGNSAAHGGAVAIVEGALGLDHVTAAGNASADGSALWRSFGTYAIRRSALVTPGGGGVLCAVSAANGGATPLATAVVHSLLADASCGTGASGIVSAADPQLGPLAANGGATPTRLPAAGSPLGGIVPAAACPIVSDQRGSARPQGPNCDAGAVEISESVAAAATITGTSKADLLTGTPKKDVIDGLAGNDVLLGLANDDELRGGAGNDVLTGGAGKDRLYGGPGIDVLFADKDDTVVSGGDGKDLCWLPGKLLPVDC
ncbi:MAG: right-handed parallel beta-helix repeat-containing protein [Solirubrobacteraceae bacterium]|nr:right-handed parallel beta-helix repeat-containing protein [Solirubrobacteraceae bacterium]